MPFLTLTQAVALLSQGKVIAYPTEAVFGLGCDPKNEQALENLIQLKGRSVHKGFILIASHIDQVLPYINLSQVSEMMWQQIQKSWPGSYTWVFPARSAVLPLVKGAQQSVALRVTAHPVARALCDAFGGMIVSTSANTSDQPPLQKAQAVWAQFGDNIAGILPGEVNPLLKPSRIQDAVSAKVYRQ